MEPHRLRFVATSSKGEVGALLLRPADASALLVLAHGAGAQPGVERAAHLSAVPEPMRFLQGTRDALADLALMQSVCDALPRATLHVVDGADHGFHVLKRTGRDDVAVLNELADVTAAW